MQLSPEGLFPSYQRAQRRAIANGTTVSETVSGHLVTGKHTSSAGLPGASKDILAGGSRRQAPLVATASLPARRVRATSFSLSGLSPPCKREGPSAPTAYDSTTTILRESPPACSNRNLTDGQGDSNGNFSDHSKITTAGAANTSSSPKVSKS